MSRLGKQPIILPSGVDATLVGDTLTVKGAKGTLARDFKQTIVGVTIEGNTITLSPQNESDEARALWGTYAAHVRNMVLGVTEGFTKVLEIEGVGYRAEVRGSSIVLLVGYSHPVELPIPDGITATVEKGVVTLTGNDIETLGQYAANVRAVRPPDPYKGKGIHYRGDFIIRKQGKKAV